MKLYALHDKVAKALSAFQVAKGDASVTRDFAQAVLEPKSLLGKYPDDFELVVFATLSEDMIEGGVVCTPFPYLVVVTARQVLDLQPVRESGDPAQLRLG